MSETERNVCPCRRFPCVDSSECSYKTRQHRARCQYRGQCVKQTDGMAARNRKKGFKTQDGDHGGEFDVDGEAVR